MSDRLSETTTVRLLDAWKTLKGIDTDYRAAKELGVSHGTPANWRHLRSHAKPSLAAKMAKDLGMDELAVLAAVEADRAHNGDDRRVWQRFGKGAFVALVLATSTVSPLRAAQAPGPLLPQEGSQTIHVSDHYAKWRIGRHGREFDGFGFGSVSFFNSCPFCLDHALH
ncbi:hypothetical protein [Xanthomonas campestris]|uniref:hypothetical protein n=1 Tax=Xanthomonas campestris TaxID=339 RepID=UPI003CF83AF8